MCPSGFRSVEYVESGSPVEMSEWDAWMKIVKEGKLPFDIEGNPIVIIVDLDELIR